MARPKNPTAASWNRIVGFVLLLTAVLITILIPHPAFALRLSIYVLFGFSIALILIKSSGDAQVSVKARNIGITIIGGAALPFALMILDPIGKFKDTSGEKLVGTTVFVHGKKGVMDMVLRQKGHVLMELNGDRQKKPISENGDAHFENLRLGDKVRLDIDFSEPYRAVHKDSVYTIDESGRLYLQVALEGIDRISGTVLYRDEPLEGVIVKTGELIDTTGSTGDYIIRIPETLQAKQYEVWFMKKGFQTISATAYPQTGQPLNIIMNKN